MVAIADLKKAHYIAAKLVQKFGAEYLIFFERIDKELKDAEKKLSLMDAALDVAIRGPRVCLNPLTAGI